MSAKNMTGLDRKVKKLGLSGAKLRLGYTRADLLIWRAESLEIKMIKDIYEKIFEFQNHRENLDGDSMTRPCTVKSFRTLIYENSDMTFKVFIFKCVSVVLLGTDEPLCLGL